MSNKQGIAIAGSILVDEINEISSYPACGELTQIRKVERSTGGCVPNVAMDLKKLCPTLSVTALGKIGDDEMGTYASNVMADAGVDVASVVVAAGEKTSFTQVMSIDGGQRTFFTYAGASALFGADDIPFDMVQPRILLLGYFLLLNKIDNGDGLTVLKEASARGIKTSIDLVSENSDRYSLVLPCLPYTDYLIVNEFEAGKLAGIEPTADNLITIARRLQELGVREKVIIHQPHSALCVSGDEVTVVPSYQLPSGYIKGTTGAGDAFCAGALLGLYEGWSDREILEFASSAAVAALGSADATSGLKTVDEVRALCAGLSRQVL